MVQENLLWSLSNKSRLITLQECVPRTRARPSGAVPLSLRCRLCSPLVSPPLPIFHPYHQHARKVDVRLPGKGNSNSHGARPVRPIITMIKWIRTSRLPVKKNFLSPIWGDGVGGPHPPIPFSTFEESANVNLRGLTASEFPTHLEFPNLPSPLVCILPR